MKRLFNLLVDVGLNHAYPRQIVHGASQFCQKNPTFRLKTSYSDTSFTHDRNVVDGVITLIDDANKPHPATRFGVPVVNVSSNVIPVPFPTVAADNRAIGQLAADHLIQQGYRSFACHMDSLLFFSSERCGGFVDALTQAGYPASIFDSARDCGADAASRRDETIAWLRKLPMPLGLFAHHDLRAAALLDLCQDAKFHVPNDIGLIGVDNDDVLTHMPSPHLSSVDPASDVIGYRAAELLAQVLEGGKAPDEPIFFPPKCVVVRRSTEPSGLIDDRLSAALCYIREHGTRMMTVENMLEAVPASRRSIERLFQTQLGRSPAQELLRVRVNHAKWLLMGSDGTLPDVAQRCGYTNFRNFATAFRNEVGLTPSQFRKRFHTG